MKRTLFTTACVLAAIVTQVLTLQEVTSGTGNKSISSRSPVKIDCGSAGAFSQTG